MSITYVCGHRNPDTDAIVSAMSYAALRNAIGDNEYVAVRLGQPNDETSFLLRHFGGFDFLLSLGDPLWKFSVLTIAVLTALLLSFDIFSWPLRKLQALIDKIPLIPCIVMDSVMLIAAAVVNIWFPI